MSHIDNLIPDVYQLLQTDGWFTDALATDFSQEVTKRLKENFRERTGKPTLRLSQMGDKCPCALWHSLHKPELAEPLPPWAKFKYSYGHIIEALAICLAKASGHEVTGEQDAVSVDGIVGHRDCIIDGCLVDVKSTSSRGFSKFKDGSIEMDDPFGYMAQLDGYLVGSRDDDLVRVKDRAYDWAIDKTLGHMVLHEHHLRADNIKQRIVQYKEIVGRSSAPDCNCKSVKDGESGNLKLDLQASYNAYKYCCDPRIRTFLYSNGPRYLTRVVRKPDVTEIDRYGKVVYN